jgi:hypothetical protein
LDLFGRIGAFQWVTANPNTKIVSLFSTHAPSDLVATKVIPAYRESIAQVPDI